MSIPTIDTREMTAIHETLRKEFASLPLLVKSVGEGDSGRAQIVGDHVMRMCMILHGHHGAEDALLWPILQERAPADAELVNLMEVQHVLLGSMIEAAEARCGAWMADTNIATRSSLHTTLIALERSMLEHLSVEETQIMPVVDVTLTQEEFDAVGMHARAGLEPDQLAIGLGMILDDNSAAIGEMVLSGMPVEARAGFEKFGLPMYREYRARLLDRA